MKNPISILRISIKRHYIGMAIFALGVVAGNVVNPSVFYAVSELFGSFSPKALKATCLIMTLLSLLLCVSFLVLHEEYVKYKKYLNEFAPVGFDIDAHEEEEEAMEKAFNKT